MVVVLRGAEDRGVVEVHQANLDDFQPPRRLHVQDLRQRDRLLGAAHREALVGDSLLLEELGAEAKQLRPRLTTVVQGRRWRPIVRVFNSSQRFFITRVWHNRRGLYIHKANIVGER